MGRLFLGMDGGGSGARARLADHFGRALGEGRGGPANIGRDVEAAISALEAAADAALLSAGLTLAHRSELSVVIGAAGAAVPGAVERVCAAPFGFASLKIVTDAEIALAGAFPDGDGGILILGTGSQAYGRVGETRLRFGGWGAAISDSGSGAVLGQAAARRALDALEGLAEASPFTAVLADRLGGTPSALSAWSLKARPTDWAGLAPLVFDHAEAGDLVAADLLAGALCAVEALIARLARDGIGRIALLGGLAARYRPLLSAATARMVVDPAGDALDGAIHLARQAEAT
jgi:glucosamine kinase